MWGRGGSSPYTYSAHEDDPRRRAKRHATDALESDLGEVLDLSRVGMRVACRGKPQLALGKSGTIKLKTVEGSLAVTGRVVWVHRMGFRKYQMGIEFVNVSRPLAKAIESLAEFGFLSTSGGAAFSASPPRRQTPPPKPKAEPKPSRPKKSGVRASLGIPDYYEVLGITPKASDDEIRAAFRSLARKVHPDVSHKPDAAARFMQVNEAYEVLRDADRRKKYDRKMAG